MCGLSRAQIEFGSGNPQYASTVRNGLLCLVSSSHLPAQRIAAQAINAFISPESPSHIPDEVYNYPASFIPSIIAMLSHEVSASHEALHMLQQLVRCTPFSRPRVTPSALTHSVWPVLQILNPEICALIVGGLVRVADEWCDSTLPHPTLVLTSPLQRALQTAAIM